MLNPYPCLKKAAYKILVGMALLAIYSSSFSNCSHTRPIKKLIISSSAIDRNNDGIVDEFVGRKKRFSLEKDPIITLTAILENCSEEEKCENWEIIVYGPEAGISEKGELENELDPVVVHPILYLKETCGLGKYRAVLKVDGKEADKKNFKIKR